MTKYYVTGLGVYVGGFDGALPPAGSFEVQFPPPHGGAIWNGAFWVVPDALNKDLIELNREKAVKDQGISLEDKVTALWEKVMNADSKKADDIQIVVEQAKTDFPLPS